MKALQGNSGWSREPSNKACHAVGSNNSLLFVFVNLIEKPVSVLVKSVWTYYIFQRVSNWLLEQICLKNSQTQHWPVGLALVSVWSPNTELCLRNQCQMKTYTRRYGKLKSTFFQFPTMLFRTGWNVWDWRDCTSQRYCIYTDSPTGPRLCVYVCV